MQIKKEKLPPKYLKKGKKQSSVVIILKGMQGLKSPCNDNCMYLNQYELFASWMKRLLASMLWDEFHTKVEDIREQWPPLPWERWSALHWKQKNNKRQAIPRAEHRVCSCCTRPTAGGCYCLFKCFSRPGGLTHCPRTFPGGKKKKKSSSGCELPWC